MTPDQVKALMKLNDEITSLKTWKQETIKFLKMIKSQVLDSSNPDINITDNIDEYLLKTGSSR